MKLDYDTRKKKKKKYEGYFLKDILIPAKNEKWANFIIKFNEKKTNPNVN